MTLTLTHPFVSLKADGPDATVVRPSNWNDNHDAFFTAAGGVTRQLNDKVAEYVSVTDFASATAAVAYLAGLGGGRLHIPQGVSASLPGSYGTTLVDYEGPFASSFVFGNVFTTYQAVYSANDGSHNGMPWYTLFLESDPVGSLGAGVGIGPFSADFGLGIVVEKQNWTIPASAQPGEVDAINIWVRQGGPTGGVSGTSDCSGILLNIQNCGTPGGVSMLEGSSTNIDSNTFALIRGINIQMAPIATNAPGNQGVGLSIAGSAGALRTGFLLSSQGGSTWQNGIVLNDGSTDQIIIDMDGFVSVDRIRLRPRTIAPTPQQGLMYFNGNTGRLMLCQDGVNFVTVTAV
jgi:hypothetical protein